LCVQVDGKTVLAGNSKLLDSAGISYPDTENPGTIVYVAVNGVYAGMIVMADEVKPDSAAAISQLKSMGIKNIAMFTGDTRHTSESIGQKAGVDSVYAELLPHEKLEKLAEIARDKNNKRPIVFVGDGINDAPVLARAEIGVAMGGVGSDAAIEAADIVLMTDEPSKLVTAMQIAKKTHGIVWQNIIFALGVKGVILALGALGIASMWEAVFGDVGVAVIAILNALRAMRAP
jgi:Cd2+/Zn2+-exporting ATPase